MKHAKPSIVVAPRSTMEAECLAITLESLDMTAVMSPTPRSVLTVVALPRGDTSLDQRLVREVTAWRLPTLLLVETVGPWTIAMARAVDAVGLVSWDSTPSMVAQVIRNQLEGRSVPSMGGTTAQDPFVNLTEREREVISLVALGDHDEDIARRLRISPHTARAHVQNCLTKLDVTNRHAAAALARNSDVMRTRLQDLRSLGSRVGV
jgi:DNA-binding NarL/FixJ family response regulator